MITREQIEAELDRLELNAAATVEHFLHGGEGLDWPSMAPVLRLYIHDWTPAHTRPLIAAARRVLQRHEHRRERIAGERFDVLTGQPLPAEYETTCVVCGWVGVNEDPESWCAEIRDVAASLGISSEEGTRP